MSYATKKAKLREAKQRGRYNRWLRGYKKSRRTMPWHRCPGFGQICRHFTRDERRRQRGGRGKWVRVLQSGRIEFG